MARRMMLTIFTDAVALKMNEKASDTHYVGPPALLLLVRRG